MILPHFNAPPSVLELFFPGELIILGLINCSVRLIIGPVRRLISDNGTSEFPAKLVEVAETIFPALELIYVSVLPARVF